MDAPWVTDQLSHLASEDVVFEQYAGSAAYIAEAPLPEEWRTPCFMGPPRMQGKRSTCAAFVGATIAQAVMQRNVTLTDDLYIAAEIMSPEFIYYHRTNKPAHGMCGRDVFRILREHGAVYERDFPYREPPPNVTGERDDAAPPPSELYSRAKAHCISGFARVETADGLRRALYLNGPCFITLPLFNTLPEFWRRPPDYTGPVRYHSCTVVGWTSAGFTIRNTWGRTWNHTGETVLPLAEWSLVCECWTGFSAARITPGRRRASAKFHSLTIKTPPALRRAASPEVVAAEGDKKRDSCGIQ